MFQATQAKWLYLPLRGQAMRKRKKKKKKAIRQKLTSIGTHR